MKKIKVAHLTSVHPFGDVRIFHKECVSLAENGYDVYLVVPNTESKIVDGVNVISIDYKHTSRLDRMKNTVKKVYKKAIEIDADIYHFHDPELLKIGLRLKRKGKIVIYDVHEDVPRDILSKTYINKVLRVLISFFVEKYENYISKRLDAIVTATPFIEKRFLKINPNSFNINNFPLEREIESNISTEEDIKKQNKVCYIGVVDKIRGIKVLVDSLDKTNITLDLAGEIHPESFKDELFESENWNKVNYLGYINREESKKVKSESIAGIVNFLPEPNHINAQPNKMFEYMASSLPIIASNFPLWREIIEVNQCGICINPEDKDELSNAINYLYENPEVATKMGENGKKMVIEKYNWNKEKVKLFEVYEKLLN